jgi:DNA-binding MarR family transcriptional regulator
MLKFINSRGLDPVQWAVLAQQSDSGKTAIQIAEDIGQTQSHVRRKLSRLSKQTAAERGALLAEAMRREFVTLETALFSGDLETATKLARALVASSAAFKLKEALVDHFYSPAETPAQANQKAQLTDDEIAQLKAQIKRKLASIDECRPAMAMDRRSIHGRNSDDQPGLVSELNGCPMAARK